jgi:hypothetical protein
MEQNIASIRAPKRELCRTDCTPIPHLSYQYLVLEPRSSRRDRRRSHHRVFRDRARREAISSQVPMRLGDIQSTRSSRRLWFHHQSSPRRARPNILRVVSFICTTVPCPDIDDIKMLTAEKDVPVHLVKSRSGTDA